MATAATVFEAVLALLLLVGLLGTFWLGYGLGMAEVRPLGFFVTIFLVCNTRNWS